MREYRFRAWNKEKEIMCHENEDDTADNWDGAFSSDVGMVNYIINRDFDHVFMQWTGKNAKNAPIFEGDIISDNAGRTFHVKYSNKKASYVCVYIKNETHEKSFSEFNKLQKPFKVIGNIYQNKDLLEQP